MKLRRLMQLPVEGKAYQRAALCVTAKLAAKCSDGSLAAEAVRAERRFISALPQNRKCQSAVVERRFVPGADICSAANCRLFDHLVGAQQERIRDHQAERLRGREVYDEIEFRRLFNWNVARFPAFQNFVYKIARTSV